MKKIIASAATLMLAAIVLVSFTTDKGTTELDRAGIVWTGKKLTGSHTGTLNFSRTDLQFKEDVLVSALFEVDMTSLKNTDLDEESAGKLVGHLSSDDFFGIKDHPTASFTSTSIEAMKDGNYKITGNMSIKGVTNSETFEVNVRGKGGVYQANADIMIDRTKYGVKYGSGTFFENLGDKAIFDEFNLTIQIEKHNH